MDEKWPTKVHTTFFTQFSSLFTSFALLKSKFVFVCFFPNVNVIHHCIWLPKYLAVWSDCPDSFKKKMWSRMSGWVAFCFNQTLNWFQSKCKLVQAYFLGKKLSRCLISFKLFNMVICSWYCLHYGHESHEWPKILNGKRLTCSQNQGNSDPLQPNQNLHWMMNWCLSYHINIIL